MTDPKVEATTSPKTRRQAVECIVGDQSSRLDLRCQAASLREGALGLPGVNTCSCEATEFSLPWAIASGECRSLDSLSERL